MKYPPIFLCGMPRVARWIRLVEDHLAAQGLLPGKHVLTFVPEDAHLISNRILEAIEQARVAIPVLCPEFLNHRMMTQHVIPELVSRAKIVRAQGRAVLNFWPLVAIDANFGRLAVEMVSEIKAEDKAAPLARQDADVLHRTLRKYVYRLRKSMEEIKTLPDDCVWEKPRPYDLYLQNFASPLAEWIEREDLLHKMELAWMTPAKRACVLTGESGSGKSTLLAQWMQRMRRDDFRRAERVFCWSFQRQRVSSAIGSSEEFFRRALDFCGENRTLQINPWDLGRRMAELVASSRTLVVLDDVDRLQYPLGERAGQLHDLALLSFLRAIANNNPGMCVAASSLPLRDLEDISPNHVLRLDVGALERPEAEALAAKFMREEEPTMVGEVCNAGDGHPLTLRLIGEWYHRSRDARKFQQISRFRIERRQGTHLKELFVAHLQGLEAAEIQFLLTLSTLGGYGEWPALVQMLQSPVAGLTDQLCPATTENLRQLVKSLQSRGFVEANDECVVLHTSLKKVVTKLFPQDCQAAAQELHRLLFQREMSSVAETPDTFAKLLDLLHGIWHGCRSELRKEAFQQFWTRCCLEQIGRRPLAAGDEFAVALGFYDPAKEQPRSELGDELVPIAWRVLRFYLRSAGRLVEASMHAERHLNWAVARGQSVQATNCLLELAELDLLQGQIKRATERTNKLFEIPGLRSATDLFHDTVRISGRILQLKGKYKEALDRYQLADSAKDAKSILVGSDCWRAETLFDAGDFPAAEKAAWRVVDAQKGAPPDVAVGHAIVLAKLYLSLSLHSKDWRFREEADRHANEAHALSDEAGRMEFVVASMPVRAGIFRMARQVDEAESLLNSASFLSVHCHMPLVHIDTMIERGRLRLMCGDQTQAKSFGEKAKAAAKDLLYGRCARELKPLLPVAAAPTNSAEESPSQLG